MRQFLPPIGIKVSGSSSLFLERMAEIAEASGNIVVEKHFNALGQSGFNVINLRFGGASLHESPGGQLIVHPDTPLHVSVEMRAQWWSPDNLPTYQTYCTEAKLLISPLLKTYNRTFNTRYRMVIPSRERLGPKLSPHSEKLFKRFAVLANKSSLHPTDWQRFYEFVRNSRRRKRLYEDELTHLLIREGFSKDHAERISNLYVHLSEFSGSRRHPNCFDENDLCPGGEV